MTNIEFSLCKESLAFRSLCEPIRGWKKDKEEKATIFHFYFCTMGNRLLVSSLKFSTAMFEWAVTEAVALERIQRQRGLKSNKLQIKIRSCWIEKNNDSLPNEMLYTILKGWTMSLYTSFALVKFFLVGDFELESPSAYNFHPSSTHVVRVCVCTCMGCRPDKSSLCG